MTGVIKRLYVALRGLARHLMMGPFPGISNPQVALISPREVSPPFLDQTLLVRGILAQLLLYGYVVLDILALTL